jgi:hypothetical protein
MSGNLLYLPIEHLITQIFCFIGIILIFTIISFCPEFFFKLLFMASGVVLSPLPEVYTLLGEGGGIRTRVS